MCCHILQKFPHQTILYVIILPYFLEIYAETACHLHAEAMHPFHSNETSLNIFLYVIFMLFLE